MPLLSVTVEAAGAGRQHLQFDRTFRIGRVPDCDVCINNEYVSRAHVEVAYDNGKWSVRDLESSNGIFVEGQRVQCIAVNGKVSISLGIAGPVVVLESAPAVIPAFENEGETQWLKRHFEGPDENEPVGEHTLMVRRAFVRVQRKQRWTYGIVIGFLVLLIILAGIYGIFLRRQVRDNVQLAQELFYSMKLLDVETAKIEQVAAETKSEKGEEEIRRSRERREEMQRNYDKFLTTLNVYDSRLSERNRLILRVARIFGESELAMPPDFADEVSKYVAMWQSSGRYAQAVATAKKNGFNDAIAREFLRHDLPPQFFYLAMQESDFDPYTSGRMTRKGIAKGMWQFIPETGAKYGLKIGPLVDLPRADPGDDRDRFDRSTEAAARYIKDLYSTDAQASGLLVMACYNWGDNQVLPLVRSLPANPKDRNFWQLLKKYRERIPKETYDYVFYIVSAAVIGEAPRLFGFDFDNPLAESRGGQSQTTAR